MKRKFLSLLLIMALLIPSVGLAAGFSQDKYAIEAAADSVLLLEIYDNRRDLVATGSGFVAFDSDTVVTNYHVIEDARYITATDDDGQQYELTKVYCADEKNDIAILGFEKHTSLTPLPLRATQELMRGEAILAIGSPEGYKNTVSTGIISSVYTEDGVPIIQITAPISHGSSGGALFNDDGEVIGVTYATLEDAQNLNFAVNISAVKAMRNAWDGSVYTLKDHKSRASFDYSRVYDDETAPISGTEIRVEATPEPVTPSYGSTTPPISTIGWTCVCGKANNGSKCGSCGKTVDSLIGLADKGIRAQEGGRYSNTIDIYLALGSFDSGVYRTEAGAGWNARTALRGVCGDCALSMLRTGDFDGAEQLLNDTARDADDPDLARECWYDCGKQLLAEGDTDAAAEALGNAGSYADAQALRQQALSGGSGAAASPFGGIFGNFFGTDDPKAEPAATPFGGLFGAFSGTTPSDPAGDAYDEFIKALLKSSGF